MRNFLVTNHYNMQNMGEVLQLQALRESMPEDKFTVQGLYSFIDEELCRKMNIDYVGTTKPQSLPKIALTIAKLTARAVVSGVYNDYDMVIDLGGDTFSDKPNIKYTIMHSLTLLPFAVARKPYVICSQSIGPFGITTKPLAKYILRRASAVTVRDATSQEYLSKLGIDSELHPDLAYLHKAVSLPEERHSIGVNLSALAPSRMGTSFDEYASLATKLVTELQKRYDIILIPHVYGPKKGLGSVSNTDDRDVIRHVAEQTSAKVGTHEDVTRCNLFIGFRMHACIKAISLGIPTVAIGYSHKIRSLPNFTWIRTLDTKTLTLKSILSAVSELKKASVDEEVLQAFTSEASGHIDTINRVHRKHTERIIGPHIKCYVGYSTHPEIRKGAASGGATKALAIASNRKVVTLEPDGLKPRVTTYNDAHEILQGSIYSFDTEPTKQMHTLVVDNTTVIGTPCQIGATQGRNNVLRIGLFCSHKVEREGVELLLKHLKLKGDKIEYRAKVNGDTGMLIDNEFFVPLSAYWKCFLNYAFIPSQCLWCKNLTNERADISLGDAWGLAKDANVIITRTEKGEVLLQEAIRDGLLHVDEINAQRLIKTQNYLTVKKDAKTLKVRVYRLLRAFGSKTLKHKLIANLWLSIIIDKKGAKRSNFTLV